MRQATALEAVLRRDRAIVLAGLVGIAAITWGYMLFLAFGDRAAGMGMSQVLPWSAVDFGLMYVMWAVMMTAMMIPTAAPMILVFASVNRRKVEQQRPYVSTGIFVSGYLVAWLGFASVATFTQWGLHQATLMSSMMGNATPLLGGALLVIAGVFQFTPLKYVCLNHCRTPMSFIMTEWRDGERGALVMGVRHGAFCLGCCWFLMGLMFVAGVMNILWMAGIASYILIEKVAPAGHWIGRASGLLIIGWGIYLMANAMA